MVQRNGNPLSPSPSVQGIADGGRGGESVVAPPNYEQQPYAPLVFQLAAVADDIPAWGQDPATRDAHLRSFWPTESILASAVYAFTARNSAFSWTLEGPPRTVAAVQDRLHMADNGAGWQQFMMKVTTDLLTQDNGAFIEVIRAGPNEGDPVVGIAHLDAGRCRRTGVPEFPVVYTDRRGLQHKLRPWQVIAWAEFPSPVETMNGVGLCAVSRVLRMAQLMRDIAVYQREKVTGRNPQSIFLVSGVSTKMISDAVQTNSATHDAQGALRFILPVVVGSLDPTASVSVDKIDMASLPDSFDLDTTLKWYITQLALGFGADYQDIAPMSLGGLGSSAQSLVLHMKSRGKGPALFMKAIEYFFNFHGVLPRTVTFRYDEQDIAADIETAELERTRADSLKIYVETGILTPEGARQKMLDAGDISPELFDAMQLTPDLTSDVTVPDNDPDQPDDAETNRVQPQPAPQQLPAASPVRVLPLVSGQPPQTGRRALALGRKGIMAAWADADRAAWEQSYGFAVAGVLREAFRELRPRVLAAGNVAGEPAHRIKVIDDLLTDPQWWETFAANCRQVATPAFRTIATASALQVIEAEGEHGLVGGTPVNFDVVTASLAPMVGTYAAAWQDAVATSTRRAIESAALGWRQSGLDERGLPDLVAALEPWFSAERAGRLAVTEVTRMADAGALLVRREAGILEEVWETSGQASDHPQETSGQASDHPQETDSVATKESCAYCGPLDGKVFGLYEGPRPPLHADCRCQRVGVAMAGLLPVP